MSFAERVLSELEHGQWTLKSIAPSFRRRLATGLQINPQAKNISELCMEFYGKIDAGQILIPNLSQAIEPSDLDSSAKHIIGSVFVDDYEGSSIGEFEPEIHSRLQEALRLIDKISQSLSTLRKELVSGFIRAKGVDFRSASHPHLFGLILIGDGVEQQTALQLAVSVIHEMAHQELFLVNLLDRLVNQPFDYNEVHAPFQGMKRPPIGRLHSLWALYRMVQFQQMTGDINQKHQDLLRQNVEAFADQELTLFAKRLVEIARRQAS